MHPVDALARQIFDCNSGNNIDYYMDETMSYAHCTDREKELIKEIRAQGNDLDCIHLCCAKHLKLDDTVTQLTNWIAGKASRKSKGMKKMNSESLDDTPIDEPTELNAAALQDAIRKGECDDWVVPGSQNTTVEESFRE